jgi:ribosome-associated translation inhibitor RaiA/cold shock CspA family protein
MDPSPALESLIQEKIKKLYTRFPTLIRCHVTVEGSAQHQNKGNTFSVHIVATFPGYEKVVSQHPGKKPERHTQVYAAMNDAFKAITKQLNSAKESQRRDIKEHVSVMLDGRVIGLDIGQEYGFLALKDGTEFYFHKNAVDGDRFLELNVGNKVRFSFIEGEGIEGPQANVVHIVAKKKET